MSALGSKADICSAQAHVRFTPNSDRESGLPAKDMSALPPRADMCSALANVGYGPKADIGWSFSPEELTSRSVTLHPVRCAFDREAWRWLRPLMRSRGRCPHTTLRPTFTITRSTRSGSGTANGPSLASGLKLAQKFWMSAVEAAFPLSPPLRLWGQTDSS